MAGLSVKRWDYRRARKFKELLFIGLGVPLLRFLCQSKRSQTFCFLANGARSRLVFSHRLSTVTSTFFLFETFFRSLSGQIGIHSRSLV